MAVLLRSIEGTLKDLLLKLKVTDAAHIHTDSGHQSPEEDRERGVVRCKKLLDMAVKALTKLQNDPETDSITLGIEPGAGATGAERAEYALARQMAGNPRGY